ncbi:MAG: endonuclease domain-containing protein [Caulobacteraceae bacterium]
MACSAKPPSPDGEGQTPKASGWGTSGKRSAVRRLPHKTWKKSREVTRRARDLRKALTPQEARLWLRLRALRPEGFHFRRQAPFLGFYLDFVCFRSRLVVEADGSQHNDSVQADHDAMRDSILSRAGFRTLRFSNADLNVNIDGVVETILAELASGSPILAAGAACPNPEGVGEL